MKVGAATWRDDVVTARVGAGDSTQAWWYRAPELSPDRSADALLAATLLPAMRRGETLTFSEAVSPRLLGAVDRIQDVVRAWREVPGFDRYQRVPVDAAPRAASRPREGRGRAAFFTAGVDSCYTALRHRDELDALVYVQGFDVALDDADLGARALHGVRSAALELGLPLVVVQTDVRSFSEPYARWDHYHGAALASVAHLLADHFSTVYLPATQTFATLTPLGSHPLLDPLWSSEDVEIVHDGCEASRIDKLDAISAVPAARHWLRVCWENRGGRYNCGRCEKCLRTMVALDALGLLGAFDTFPGTISTTDITRVRLPDAPRTWESSLALLEATGRDPAVARAVRRRLHGPSTRAMHRAVYYAHRLRALARS